MSCSVSQLPVVQREVIHPRWSNLKGLAGAAVFAAFGSNVQSVDAFDVSARNIAYNVDSITRFQERQQRQQLRQRAKVVGEASSATKKMSPKKRHRPQYKKGRLDRVGKRRSPLKKKPVDSQVNWLPILLSLVQSRAPDNKTQQVSGGSKSPAQNLQIDNTTTNAVTEGVESTKVHDHSTIHSGEAESKQSYITYANKDSCRSAVVAGSSHLTNVLHEDKTISTEASLAASENSSFTLPQRCHILGGADPYALAYVEETEAEQRERYEILKEEFPSVNYLDFEVMAENSGQIKTVELLKESNTFEKMKIAIFAADRAKVIYYLELMHHKKFLRTLANALKDQRLPASYESWMRNLEPLVKLYRQSSLPPALPDIRDPSEWNVDPHKMSSSDVSPFLSVNLVDWDLNPSKFIYDEGPPLFGSLYMMVGNGDKILDNRNEMANTRYAPLLVPKRLLVKYSKFDALVCRDFLPGEKSSAYELYRAYFVESLLWIVHSKEGCKVHAAYAHRGLVLPKAQVVAAYRLRPKAPAPPPPPIWKRATGAVRTGWRSVRRSLRRKD